MKRPRGGQDTARGEEVQPLVAPLERSRPGFWLAYSSFLQRADLVSLPIDPDEVFADLRDPSPGRDVDDVFS